MNIFRTMKRLMSQSNRETPTSESWLDSLRLKKPTRRKWDLSKNCWMICFCIAFLSVVAIIGVFLVSPPKRGTIFYALTDGFVGNNVSGIVSGILFLFLALHLGKKTEEQIEKSAAILERHDTDLKLKQRINQFEYFMQNEAYHNVRFPDLKDSESQLGLEYTVEPCRNGDGKPKTKKSEMYEYFVVRVRALKDRALFNNDTMMRYAKSPICEEEPYFCNFFNGDWHMSRDSFGDWHRFYLSGKNGQVERGQSANQFMGFETDPSDKQLVCEMYITDEGTELVGGGGCTIHKIFRDEKERLFLKIHDSPLKRIYLTNTKNSSSDDWFFAIENIRGYASGNVLDSLKKTISRKLTENNVEIPKVHWYEVHWIHT